MLAILVIVEVVDVWCALVVGGIDCDAGIDDVDVVGGDEIQKLVLGALFRNLFINVMKQVALNISRFLLKFILENTQTFTTTYKDNTKVIKMPSWKAWLVRDLVV